MKISIRGIAVAMFCLVHLGLGAQVFVDKDANGANDGSSWQDAYSDLTVALNGSAEGNQVWVADGTYFPGNDMPIRDTFFTLPHDLELYGGFNGTESDLADRDPITNVVMLSGDYQGNDVDGDFSSNKEDNALHVMFLTEDITSNTIIDGFTFAYGQTDDSSSSGNRRRGGGILSFGTARISNCIFRENFGWFGGGLYPRGITAESMQISNCTFTENSAGFGGGFYVTQDNIIIENCIVTNNRAENSGGGGYNSSTDSQITACVFEGNVAVDSRGGAVYNSNVSTNYIDCMYRNNSAAASTGGAMHFRTQDDEPSTSSQITNCTFRDGLANWGGAIAVYDFKSTVTFNDCTFTSNSAFASGGAVHTGFGATANINNCDISNNDAQQGGAFNSQNDSTSVYIFDSFVADNSSVNGGGAFNMTSDDTIGTMLPLLSIDKTIITSNTSASQGGAINILNTNLFINNSVILENINSSDTGAGGALSINGFEGRNISAEIINTTFYGNIAFSGVGGGIAHFTDSLGVSELRLQNTILSGSLGLNYMVEAGTPTVESTGGNHSDDESLSELLVSENDLNSEMAGFVNALGLDLHLSDTSPCINTGINGGTSSEDIEGNPRQGDVDKGAYEFQGMVSVADIISKHLIKVFPNPTAHKVSIQFENSWRGKLKVSILDVSGTSLRGHEFNKLAEQFNKELSLDGLPAGIYVLKFEFGGKVVSKGVYKKE